MSSAMLHSVCRGLCVRMPGWRGQSMSASAGTPRSASCSSMQLHKASAFIVITDSLLCHPGNLCNHGLSKIEPSAARGYE